MRLLAVFRISRIGFTVDRARRSGAFIECGGRRQTLLQARVEFHVPDEARERTEATDGEAGDSIKKSQLQHVHLEKLPAGMEEEVPEIRLAAFAMVALCRLRGVAIEALEIAVESVRRAGDVV